MIACTSAGSPIGFVMCESTNTSYRNNGKSNDIEWLVSQYDEKNEICCINVSNGSEPNALQ